MWYKVKENVKFLYIVIQLYKLVEQKNLHYEKTSMTFCSGTLQQRKEKNCALLISQEPFLLVSRDESPENYCHSPGVVIVVVVRRQKL